ncbi:hypothetical protein K466DRAFT_657834 [Polyporus arcularius HHB13444]|uniref:Uncharacterized protein n=1 Tax=Polyporus arcularius HHB13444 TaxID=1314778 RepID=A0A5C3PWS4_9APHY|nr:hypothetical protein K466DRAFT_657834 [Polyporus arcularius HHB13444]
MESVTNDPELARDMARLLYRKLQKARRERDELRANKQCEGLLVDSSASQKENQRLRYELGEMQLSLDVATESMDSKEDIVLSPGDYSEETRHMTTQSIEDMTRFPEQERVAELQQLTDKARTYKQKYKDMKVQWVVLEENRSQMEEQLRTKRAELGATQRQMRDVELELEKAREAVDDQGSSDPSSFLSVAVEISGCPPTESLHSLPPRGITDIRRASRNPVAILSKDVQWHENTNRALVLAPGMHYNPTQRSGKGSWSQTPLHQLFRVDGSTHVEVVFLDGANYYYCGTYTTVLISAISFEEAQKISYSVARHVRDSIILHRDQVAPAVCRLVNALFTAGGLPIACFAIQRVGWDIKLGGIS